VLISLHDRTPRPWDIQQVRGAITRTKHSGVHTFPKRRRQLRKTIFDEGFSRGSNGVQRQATRVAHARKAAIHQEVTLVARRFCAI
jgi:hypothetical protein